MLAIVRDSRTCRWTARAGSRRTTTRRWCSGAQDGISCATTTLQCRTFLRMLNLDALVVKETKRYKPKSPRALSSATTPLMRVSMYVCANGTIGYIKGIKHFNLCCTKLGRGKDNLPVVLNEDQLLLLHHRRSPASKTDPDGLPHLLRRRTRQRPRYVRARDNRHVLISTSLGLPAAAGPGLPAVLSGSCAINGPARILAGGWIL